MRNLGVLFTGVLLAVGGSLGSPPTMAYAITAKDIKAFVKEHVNQKIKESGGVFKIRDVNTGQEMALEFVKVRLVRKVPGHGYFADVDFRTPASINTPSRLRMTGFGRRWNRCRGGGWSPRNTLAKQPSSRPGRSRLRSMPTLRRR
jgi:hypothetical protein